MVRLPQLSKSVFSSIMEEDIQMVAGASEVPEMWE